LREANSPRFTSSTNKSVAETIKVSKQTIISSFQFPALQLISFLSLLNVGSNIKRSGMSGREAMMKKNAVKSKKVNVSKSRFPTHPQSSSSKRQDEFTIFIQLFTCLFFAP
jgi:hypothetical protein